jgi:hypothetical protein
MSIGAHAETYWCVAEDQHFEDYAAELGALLTNPNLPRSPPKPNTIYVSPIFKYNEAHYGKDWYWVHTPFENYVQEKYHLGPSVNAQCFATSQHSRDAALQAWGQRAQVPNIVLVDRPNDGDYSQ